LHCTLQPISRRNEVLGWVKEGVRDFSISRSAVSWGIPMKQDPEHTVYVWFDALNGYLSGLLPLTAAAISSNGSSRSSSDGASSSSSSSSLDTALQQGWPADVHVIGKDILRFHAIYWPGMLMSAGLPLPKQVGPMCWHYIVSAHSASSL
jgi:methionyl-tRNA synthetase